MQFPLIYIEWCDASQSNTDWESLKEILRWAEEEHCIVTEVGFVLKETKEYLLITPQILDITDAEEQMIGGAMRIPTTWIKKRIDLSSHINQE